MEKAAFSYFKVLTQHHPEGTDLCVSAYSFTPTWGSFHFSFLILVGRAPFTGDQAVARPHLHTLQHKHRINADIHPFSGTRTHDRNVRAIGDT
jgi:hypothetical protein